MARGCTHNLPVLDENICSPSSCSPMLPRFREVFEHKRSLKYMRQVGKKAMPRNFSSNNQGQSRRTSSASVGNRTDRYRSRGSTAAGGAYRDSQEHLRHTFFPGAGPPSWARVSKSAQKGLVTGPFMAHPATGS
jgi:hypothetical protein